MPTKSALPNPTLMVSLPAQSAVAPPPAPVGPALPKGPSAPKLGKSVPVELVWIPEGDLVMASSGNSSMRRVIPMQGFWMSKYEITQAQWEDLMGTNPARFKGPQHPVESINWDEATEYCGRLAATLTDAAGASAALNYKVRLPTDTEWEYACRAGSTSSDPCGTGEGDLARAGWFDENSADTTHPVGGKQPNRWGLYDMHGNVAEWCDNLSMSWGQRVIKGGGYDDRAARCSAQYRDDRRPGGRDADIGVRIVVVPY